jgi:hypothetical protein
MHTIGDPYTKAILLAPATIAGIRLRPLSPWHVLCLLAFSNGLLVDGVTPSADDVAMALMICSSRWTGDSASDLRQVMAFRNGRRICRTMRCRLARHQDADKLLTAHIAEYFDGPDYMPDEHGGGKSKAFGPFLIAARLVAFGFAEAEAWNMPVIRARCYLAVEDEGNNVKLWSRDEEETALAAIEALERSGA